MRKALQSTIIVGFILLNFACSKQTPKFFSASEENISYKGRIETLAGEVVLIGSASSATINFTGDTCIVFLKNNNPNGQHNFFSLELDNEDLGRFKITGDTVIPVPVAITFPKEIHKLSVYKSTEAANGYINFNGIFCESVRPIEQKQKKKIEFIGNSITCGMGNDTLEIPCHKDLWYDQHNAYWAYGPTVSRALKVDFLLSSVSGIGIYRNWNGVGPVMPEVYDNLYLNTNSNTTYKNSDFNPDIISIALGTNDLSDGDGIHERLPFEPEKYTQKYISFVEHLLSDNPDAQIALLASPMVKGEKHEILISCLENVKKHFNSTDYKPFAIFTFDDIEPHGCDYHPDINDHMLMADQLYPFYKELLEKL